jgi:hypothetical protein
MLLLMRSLQLIRLWPRIRAESELQLHFWLWAGAHCWLLRSGSRRCFLCVFQRLEIMATDMTPSRNHIDANSNSRQCSPSPQT